MRHNAWLSVYITLSTCMRISFSQSLLYICTFLFTHGFRYYLIQTAVPPQPGEEGLTLKAVIGYNGNGRSNMVWSPDTGNALPPPITLREVFIRGSMCGGLSIGQFPLQACLHTPVAAWWWWRTFIRVVRDTSWVTQKRSLLWLSQMMHR